MHPAGQDNIWLTVVMLLSRDPSRELLPDAVGHLQAYGNFHLRFGIEGKQRGIVIGVLLGAGVQVGAGWPKWDVLQWILQCTNHFAPFQVQSVSQVISGFFGAWHRFPGVPGIRPGRSFPRTDRTSRQRIRTVVRLSLSHPLWRSLY